MYRKKQGLMILLAALVSCGQLYANSCPDARLWMEGLNQRVIDVVERSSSDEVKANMIADIFNPNLDVELFTKKIIGRAYWLEASETERKALQKNLYKVMLRDYTDAIVQTLAKRPEVHRIRAGDDDVSTTVTVVFHTRREKNLLANFSLKCKKDQWKIYDISIGGVRLTDLQQEKYKAVLRASGVSGLNKFLIEERFSGSKVLK